MSLMDYLLWGGILTAIFFIWWFSCLRRMREEVRRMERLFPGVEREGE